ncbi:MAG: PLP-dependent aminotransferase family protein [Pseudomonadota bacterium]|nr:PLP-dependent aminotransferase family protein [Pseudomonadota bacterium]
MSEILYDFGAGRSDPSTFPTEALQAAAVKVIGEQFEAITQYPGNLGHAGLRTAMAKREGEREGFTIDPDHLLLTNGSMQAVTLTAEALQENHGDTVLVEEFSYPGTLSAYRSLKFDMVGIRLDEGGMRIDHMEEELDRLDKEGRKPKFIYAISTYQNPTGFNMPKARRQEMIELAHRHEVPIIEDNCYADVHYEGDIEPAIFALDASPNHIYLGSLSKILAPGFRLGYVYARPPMLEKILGRRHDAGSNYLASAIAAEFYKEGIESHADVTNPVLKNKRDLTISGLKDQLEDLCVWSNPVGGLFIWVRMPDDVDRKALYESAQANGVNFLPGAAFHYKNRNKPYLRLAFGHLTEEQIQDGIPILARCLREARTSNEARTFETLFDEA